MMSADNIQYELADRVQGLAAGGIGAMLLLARRTGLIADIDQRLHLLKRHLTDHESDHVLNIAFNILAGGQKLEHLELRRNDEVYLNALGAQRGLMKTWPYSIWRVEPVLLRELPLLEGYIRNPEKQETRESGNSVTLRPFSVVTVRVEARRPRSPTY